MEWWMWLLLILVVLSLIVLIVLLLLWARRRKEGTDKAAQVMEPPAKPAQAEAEVEETAEAAEIEVEEAAEETVAEVEETATDVEEAAEEAIAEVEEAAEEAATEVEETAKETVAKVEKAAEEAAQEIAEPMASRMPEAVPVAPPPPDDLKVVEGIGPKISSVLQAAGITTWAQLAATDVDELKRILAEAKIRLGDPGTWPEQAGLAAEAKWDELAALQDGLKGGRRV